MMPALLMSDVEGGEVGGDLGGEGTNGGWVFDVEREGLHAGVGGGGFVEQRAWRRPAMMTWLPCLWKASARPRPMPDPPPVMRMVLPVVVHTSAPVWKSRWEIDGVWMRQAACGCVNFW